MTEETNRVTDTEESVTYLSEPFMTEDGIEVPPPTRPMGPRRLARYREDAAAYLRALRDGTELPEEPVAYLPSLQQESGGETVQNLSLQDRLQALAAQGSIDTSTENTADLFSAGGKDTRDVPAATQEPETYTSTSASDYDFDTEVDESDIVFDSGTTSENASSQRSHTEETAEEPENSVQVLPQPVSALEAQGLDLSEIESVPVDTEPTASSHTAVDPALSQTSNTNPLEDRIRDASEQEQSPVHGGEEKSGAGTWVALTLLVLVIACAAMWFVFFR